MTLQLKEKKKKRKKGNLDKPHALSNLDHRASLEAVSYLTRVLKHTHQ